MPSRIRRAAWPLLALWAFGAVAAPPPPAACPRPLPIVSELGADVVSPALRRQVVEALLARIEARYLYPDFGGLDWPRERRRVTERALAAPSDAAFYTELKQLVARLGDDHSEFLTPTEARLEDAGGAGYVGIGMTVGERAGARRVVALTPGGPADKAGVRRGDELLAVNGEACPPDGATRGEVGSVVSLTVRSPSGAVRTLSARREAVGAPARPSATRLADAPSVALLTLPSFTGSAADAVRSELEALLAEGAPRGLIVDVRGNGGGLAPIVRGVLGHFVTGPVARRRGRTGEEAVITAIESPLRARLANVKVAVLTDEGSSSAAELFAGALQERGRAVVVGSRSAANTEGVSSADLPDGSRLWLADTDVFLLNGRRLGDGGVTPNVPEAANWALIGTPRDPVVRRAAEVLLER